MQNLIINLNQGAGVRKVPLNVPLPPYSRFGATAMLRNTRTALDSYRTPGERIVRGFARPDMGFTGSETAHLV